MALKISMATPFGEIWTEGYVRISKVVTLNTRNADGKIPCFVRLEVFKDKATRDAKKSSVPYPSDFNLLVDENGSLLNRIYVQLKQLPEFQTAEDI
jgi:hypothetical protein